MFTEDYLAALEAARIKARSVLIVEGGTVDGYFAVYRTPEDSYPTVLRYKTSISVDYWHTKKAAMHYVAEFLKSDS
jgi:hypothetical protein